jgi:hypothetical protein
MASGTMISNVGCLAMLQALATEMDSGSLGAVIEIRTGGVPTNVEAASTGTLLAKLTCSVVAFIPAADQDPGGQLEADAIASDTGAAATDVAGYFVAGPSSVVDTIATKLIMGTAGVSGDNPDLVLDDKNIVIGGTVACTAWTINLPES